MGSIQSIPYLQRILQVIADVFTGKRSVGDAMKSWGLLMMGAGHEGFILGKLITTVFLEA